MHTLEPKVGLLFFVIAYLLIMLAIGLYFSRKKHMKTSEDFIIAGRGLGGLVLMGTFLATYTGGGTVTGGGNSLAYKFGIWPGVFFGVPAILGIIVLYLLAEKIREKNCYTVAELLEKTYGSNARIFSAFIIALAGISIASYQFRGMAFVLNAATGLSVNTGTIICAVIVIFLAMGGGMKSVAVTDAVSAFLMSIGLTFTIPFLLKIVGGWEWVLATAPAESLTLSGGQTAIGFLSAYFPLFFLTMGDQNMYMRLAAGKSLKDVKMGLLGWLVGIFLVMPAVAIIAFIARLYFGDNIAAGQALISTSTILPFVVGGILLSAATAFMITTGDSYLVSCSANVTHDIYGKINQNATDEQKFRLGRWSVLGLGIMAFVILQFFPSILAIQFWSYTIYGAGITPALLAALIWPRVTKAGGIASMVVGTLATIVWEIAGLPYGLQSVMVAVPISIITLIVVSLCTQNTVESADNHVEI